MLVYSRYFWLLILALPGCDLARLDPGGGAFSDVTVSVRPVAVPAASSSEAPTGVDQPAAPSGGTGTFSGVVLLNGTAPVLAPKVGKGASKVDPTVCAAADAIPDESLVVSPSGGIANVFIYLDRKPAAWKGTLENAVPLDQLDCIFKPHSLVAFANIPLLLKNSDKVAHNVQTFPSLNSSINASMPAGTTMETVFKKSEPKPFAAKCQIHPWMEYWTLVVDHPFVAISDSEGRFSIPNLPSGKYKFRIWHERADLLERSYAVEIKGGDAAPVELKFDAARFSR